MRWSEWRADELKDLQWFCISHWYIYLHVLWKSLRFGGYLWAAGNVISHICTSPVLVIERNVLLQAFANESPKDPISALFHCKPKNHTSKSPVMKYIEIQTWETLVFVFSYWNIFMIGPSGRCIISNGRRWEGWKRPRQRQRWQSHRAHCVSWRNHGKPFGARPSSQLPFFLKICGVYYRV